MTKRALIESLSKAGNTRRAISSSTGISLKYIQNISYDVAHPGRLKKANKNWKANHREARLASERNIKLRYQQATIPYAVKRRQKWTPAEIDYLLTHVPIETMKQIALHLGRTYRSIPPAYKRFSKIYPAGVNASGDSGNAAFEMVKVSPA